MKQRDSLRDELEEGLKQQGCVLCRLSFHGVQRVLNHLLYDMVNDPAVRGEVRLSLGFCNRHAWQMRETRGNALGLAFFYQDALLQLQEQLNAAAARNARERFDSKRKQMARAASPRTECPGCKQQREIEERFTSSLFNCLSDAAFVETLSLSDGLCRSHLERAFATAPNAEVLKTLLDTQRLIHQRLLAEIQEFIRKNDYRFAGQGFGREGDAWLRAIELLSSPRDAQS